MKTNEATDMDRARGDQKTAVDKSIEYYLSLPYTTELWRAPEGGWVAQVRELPGCVSQGETSEEALAMIQEAMQGWLEVAIEMGDTIPEPRPQEDYSGKFVVRVPRLLHRELVTAAEREGVSLNQFINTVLAQAIGRATPPRQPGWSLPIEVLEPAILRLEALTQRLELALPRAGAGLKYSSPSSIQDAVYEDKAPYAEDPARPDAETPGDTG